MQIREYQDWVEQWDRKRGWHRVNPSHTLLHAFEEMGEIARIVLQMEGYKEGGSPSSLRDDLGKELSDLLVFVFKLAYQCGVDLQDALVAGQAKAEQRYGDIPAAAQELERYLSRQTEILNEIAGPDTVGPDAVGPDTVGPDTEETDRENGD